MEDYQLLDNAIELINPTKILSKVVGTQIEAFAKKTIEKVTNLVQSKKKPSVSPTEPTDYRTELNKLILDEQFRKELKKILLDFEHESGTTFEHIKKMTQNNNISNSNFSGSNIIIQGDGNQVK